MSDNGAYGDEMTLLEQLASEDAELAAFARQMRATLPAAPNPATSAALVTRLAETARDSAAVAATAPRLVARPAPAARRRFSLTPRRLVLVAAAIAVLPLLMGGLAVAGVKLPGPADRAFDAVGIELPNQGGDDSGSEGIAPAGGTGEDETSGARGSDPGGGAGAPQEQGQGNQNGNSQGEQGTANSAEDNGNGKSQGHGKAEAPGQSKQKPAPNGGSNAGGNGQAVGKGGTPPGAANKPGDPGGAGSAPGQGKDKAKG